MTEYWYIQFCYKHIVLMVGLEFLDDFGNENDMDNIKGKSVSLQVCMYGLNYYVWCMLFGLDCCYG